MPKSTKIILILAVLIVVGGVTYALWPRNENIINQNTNAVINVNINSNTNVNNNQNSEIDTSDWLTHKNEEYGFEFKYPASFKLQYNNTEDLLKIIFEMPSDYIKKYLNNLSLVMISNPNKLSIEEIMKQRGFLTIEDFKKEQVEFGALAGSLTQKEMSVNGQRAIEYDRGAEGGGSHSMIISFGDKVLILTGNSETYAYNNDQPDKLMRQYFDAMVQSIIFN